MKKTLTGLAVTLVLPILVLSAFSANAAPPVPFYAARVTKLDRIGTGSVVIATKDSVATVVAWYRRTLRDQNGESTTKDGAHLFYTHNGATVSVEPGNRFDPETKIGMVWDARKFGPYASK